MIPSADACVRMICTSKGDILKQKNDKCEARHLHGHDSDLSKGDVVSSRYDQCWFQGHPYKIGEEVPSDYPCHRLYCHENRRVTTVVIPGCDEETVEDTKFVSDIQYFDDEEPTASVCIQHESPCDRLGPGVYAHPRNCSQYYVCQPTLRLTCPPAHRWNDETKQCQDMYTTGCTENHSQDFSCVGRIIGGFYADPSNCRKYYMCTHDPILSCTAPYVWDQTKKQCSKYATCQTRF